MNRLGLTGLALACLLHLGCAVGPRDRFNTSRLKPPVERWDGGDWALASAGFLVGLAQAPLWLIAGACSHR